jgi:hypothetical protein
MRRGPKSSTKKSVVIQSSLYSETATSSHRAVDSQRQGIPNQQRNKRKTKKPRNSTLYFKREKRAKSVPNAYSVRNNHSAWSRRIRNTQQPPAHSRHHLPLRRQTHCRSSAADPASSHRSSRSRRSQASALASLVAACPSGRE